MKVAQIANSQPCVRSHPRFVGRNSAGSESRNVAKTKIAFTTPATRLLVLVIDVPLVSSIACHERAPQWCRNIDDSTSTQRVVPVNGHWPSKTFWVTLSSVGDARSDFSDIRENPRSNPPHPANMKSMATNTIMSLVGIVALFVRLSACCKEGKDVDWRLVIEGEKNGRAQLETAGVLRAESIKTRMQILDTGKRRGVEREAAETARGIHMALEH